MTLWTPPMDDLLTLAAAAQQCGVTRDRLERAAREGRLKAVKLEGGKTLPYLVRLEDVRAYLAGSRRSPAQKPD